MDVRIPFSDFYKKYFIDGGYTYYKGSIQIIFENLSERNKEFFTLRLLCKEIMNLFIQKEGQFYPDTDHKKSSLLSVSCLYLDLYMTQEAIDEAKTKTGILFWKTLEDNKHEIRMVSLTDLMQYASEKVEQKSF
jgi:hypothetical protein